MLLNVPHRNFVTQTLEEPLPVLQHGQSPQCDTSWTTTGRHPDSTMGIQRSRAGAIEATSPSTRTAHETWMFPTRTASWTTSRRSLRLPSFSNPSMPFEEVCQNAGYAGYCVRPVSSDGKKGSSYPDIELFSPSQHQDFLSDSFCCHSPFYRNIAEKVLLFSCQNHPVLSLSKPSYCRWCKFSSHGSLLSR